MTNPSQPTPQSDSELLQILTGYAKYVKEAQGLYSYATEKKLSKKQAIERLKTWAVRRAEKLVVEARNTFVNKCQEIADTTSPNLLLNEIVNEFYTPQPGTSTKVAKKKNKS